MKPWSVWAARPVLAVLGRDRRVVGVAVDVVRLVGEVGVEPVGRQIERARIDRQHRPAERGHRLVVGAHLRAEARHERLVRPLVEAGEAAARDDLGIVGRAVAHQLEGLVGVGLLVVRDAGRSQDRRLRRDVADLVVVDPLLQLLLARQREIARDGVEGGVDERLVDPVVDDVVEADLLLRVAQLGGKRVARARRAGEVGSRTSRIGISVVNAGSVAVIAGSVAVIGGAPLVRLCRV